MKQWSRQYLCCVVCNGTDRKCFGKGLCRRCYLRQYNKENAKKVKALRRKWWLKKGGCEYSRIQREQLHYSGLREPVLKRDGYSCTECGKHDDLLVHHKNRKGRSVYPPDHCRQGLHGRGRLLPYTPDNTMENLVTLCRSCHIEIHRKELQAAKKIKTHCLRGHPYSHYNINGRPVCRVCVNANAVARRRRVKEV